MNQAGPGAYEIFLATEADTARLGARLAEELPPGGVVALQGELGAGKTRLVQAVAAALGVDPGAVTSPTFVLWHTYQGSRTLHHFDAYRLSGPGEFWGLGAEECFDGEALVLVEWASRIAAALPPARLEIELAWAGDSSRRARLTAGPGFPLDRLAAIVRDFPAA